MSRYKEIIERIFSLPSSVLKVGLSNTLTIAESIGSPHLRFKSIHIAGTNGKGSVTTKIAQALSFANYKTGLFISPHISSFRERISINGKLISEDDVVEGMEIIFNAQQLLSLTLSFFELTTLLAFWYFAKEKVDFAVMETGLGGRLDSTNIIDPVLTVITTISKDHEKILGHSLEEIGEQKAGIIKPLVPLVLGPKARLDTIYAKAKTLASPVIDVPLVEGFYDLQNQMIAKYALLELSKTYPISRDAIAEGLKKRPKCRFEIVRGDDPLLERFSHPPKALIFDVGHNPEALHQLLIALESVFPDENYRVVFGLSKDKDLDLCTKIVSSFAHHVYLVSPQNERSQDVSALHSSFFRNGFMNIEECSSIIDGVNRAINSSSNTDVVVICGTFFIMAEARHFLGLLEPRDT